MAEVGYAGATIARELPDGSLMLIDGHLRRDTTPDDLIPVLVLDVTEAEADKLLATLDPLAAMAESNQDALESLVGTIETQDDGLQAMLDGLVGAEADGAVLESIEFTKPPNRTWVLIAVDTVRFVEIAGFVESIQAVPGTVVELTANDGKPVA